MGRFTRFAQTTRKKLPRQKRTVRLPFVNVGTENGLWHACWNCGSTNNVKNRPKTNGGYSGIAPTPNGRVYTPTCGSVAGKTQADANAVSGCALCGCNNYY